MTMTLAEVDQRKLSLLASPENFLARHVVFTPGTMAPAVTGVTAIFLSEAEEHGGVSQMPGSTLGVLTRGLRRNQSDAIKISVANPNAVLGAAPLVPGVPGYHPNRQFNVQWIATQFFPPAAPGPFPWYLLTNATPLMVTQRLSGCSFAVQAVAGGGVQVAHIMPSPPESGLALRARLVALLGPGVTVYGRGPGRGTTNYRDGRDVTIIGVHTGAGWQIFAQKMDAVSFRVRSIHRIYP